MNLSSLSLVSVLALLLQLPFLEKPLARGAKLRVGIESKHCV